ncbi:hypothetical protein IAI10_22735 [Clostridium sp. 19966]|uniref:hypothetical protein n=1 Tax=Clostridium sp. 19966 TaxID=2768166 RepID=UPI0028E050DD|nr:hypothetical protein [Clostridium sp. 19966]MDT8719469.1 hypothetical protein [Clostridium sp. 19966]
MKKQLQVNVIEPESWDEFYKYLGKLMFSVWLDMCPKELKIAAIEKAKEKLSNN